MADKKVDLGRGIGDIDALLHNRGVADLSWLAVDEETYRAAEALPKQNLDVIPELQKALAKDDDGVPHLIPMRPHTVVNSNPLQTSSVVPADMTAPIRNRVAKMVMAGLPDGEIDRRLSLEFAPEHLAAASEEIELVRAERGLLGNVYVDASHFPTAAVDPREKKFAQTAGKGAMFVIGGCGGKNGCNCHQTGICNTFGGKRVVATVSYGRELAQAIAPRLAAEGRSINTSDFAGPDGSLPVGEREWKERIRAAFHQAPKGSPEPVRTFATPQRAAAPAVTQSDVDSFLARKQAAAAAEPPPSLEYLKYAQRMQLGHDDTALLRGSPDASLRRLASEHGILGHTYVDVDAFGGCRGALAAAKSRGLRPDFVLRRSASCQHCRGAADGACAQLCSGGAQLVHSRPSVDRMAFGRALKRAADQGRMPVEQARVAASRAPHEANWDALTAQANLYHVERPLVAATEYSGIAAKAHYGDPGRHDMDGPAQMDPEEVRRTLAHLMNTGLSGRALQAALLQRYSTDDLRQVPEVGRQASANDGVQGHYFVDPTAYPDYGRGCSEGSGHFRKRGAPYVLASSGCTGCTMQTAPGWCSKYAKGLIRQVPNEVRERVASARRSLPVVASAPVTNPVDEFELRSEISVEPAVKAQTVDLTLASRSVDD